MNLREKLNLLIRERGITRAHVARDTGLPYTTIDSMLKRDTFETVKLSTLHALRDYFDVSLDYLIIDCIEDRHHGRVSSDFASFDAETVEFAGYYSKLDDLDRREVRGFVRALLTKPQYKNKINAEVAKDFGA